MPPERSRKVATKGDPTHSGAAPSGGRHAGHAGRGTLLILAAATLWSLGGVGIKSLPEVPSLAIAGWRSTFALPILLPILRRRHLRLLRDPAVLAVVVSYASTLCLFVASTKLTTAANAILLQYTAPFWVILLSFWLPDERADRRDLILVLACFAGLGLFFLDRLTAEGLVGIVLGLLAGVAMGSLTTGLRRLGRRDAKSDAIVAVIVGNAVVAIVCLPWMIEVAGRAAARDWTVLGGLGVLQIAIPYVLFSAGVRHLTALRATLLAMLEPILNPVWVALGTGEIPGLGTFLGGGLILGALVADAVWRHRRPAPARPVPTDGAADGRGDL